jgi:hypothetical protein
VKSKQQQAQKHVPDLQAGEREEMPLLAALHHLPTTPSLPDPEKRQISA